MLSNSATSEKFIHTNFLARQKVKGDHKKARKKSLKMVTLGVILMISCFMFVWVRICVLDTGYKISEAIKIQGKYLQENRKLKIERASLASPSRIEKVAKNKLGMINFNNNQVVILKWSN
jgi:cell division protein FtsL